MRSFIKKISILLLIFIWEIGFIPVDIYSQACTDNQISVTLSSPVLVGNNAFTFEIWLKNTGTTSLKLNFFTTGIKYSANTFAGGSGLFTVVSQPSENDFPTCAALSVSYNASQAAVNYFRITEGAASSAVTMPTGVDMKFAVIKVECSACPNWSLSNTTLTLQAANSGAAQLCTANVYCNNNPSTTTLSAAAPVLPNTISGLSLASPLNITLPIELSSFTGKPLDHSNLLQWTTASERNVQWHNIERSADGITGWNLVGKVAGKGDSQTEQRYSLEDRAPLAKSYYRLRTVDFDGQEQISHVVVLTRKDSRFGILSAFPNPATESIAVEFNTDEESNVTILINDVTGRLIVQQEVGTTKGVNLLPIQLGQFSAGTYFITLQNGSSVTEPMRFVKQ